MEQRQEIAMSNIQVASPPFIFLKALGGCYNLAAALISHSWFTRVSQWHWHLG